MCRVGTAAVRQRRALRGLAWAAGARRLERPAVDCQPFPGLLTISERAPSILTSESTARRVGRDRRAHRTEQVVEVLREAIGTGRLRPGERLVEKHIAVELGTSRTPVREA